MPCTVGDRSSGTRAGGLRYAPSTGYYLSALQAATHPLPSDGVISAARLSGGAGSVIEPVQETLPENVQDWHYMVR